MVRIYKLTQVPSTDDYVTGLTAIQSRISEKQRRLLQVQYYTPNRKVTATQLAELANIEGGRPVVNSLYGRMGHLFCDATGFDAYKHIDDKYFWWSVWSIGYATRKNFIWEMHPEVAEALELLGWVNKNYQSKDTVFFAEEVNPSEIFREGAIRQISVNAYERDPKARQKCISHYGTSCFVCGFNFGKIFGELGEGFIHVHHLKPLSQIGTEYEVDPVKDLRPVCPNCHAMIHRKSPPLSIDEIKSLIS